MTVSLIRVLNTKFTSVCFPTKQDALETKKILIIIQSKQGVKHSKRKFWIMHHYFSLKNMVYVIF